jgi:hypothetical protein
MLYTVAKFQLIGKCYANSVGSALGPCRQCTTWQKESVLKSEFSNKIPDQPTVPSVSTKIWRDRTCMNLSKGTSICVPFSSVPIITRLALILATWGLLRLVPANHFRLTRFENYPILQYDWEDVTRTGTHGVLIGALCILKQNALNTPHSSPYQSHGAVFHHNIYPRFHNI